MTSQEGLDSIYHSTALRGSVLGRITVKRDREVPLHVTAWKGKEEEEPTSSELTEAASYHILCFLHSLLFVRRAAPGGMHRLVMLLGHFKDQLSMRLPCCAVVQFLQ